MKTHQPHAATMPATWAEFVPTARQGAAIEALEGLGYALTGVMSDAGCEAIAVLGGPHGEELLVDERGATSADPLPAPDDGCFD